ncbi:LWR-salt protein [Halorientalis pallida]|uniref:LWR-salt protein n=1 Tax=Halorientalis pallida TaxID=2479928 RepID=UPI0012929466|nr:LWR-salt protein [Halorientalis pallida]
MTTPGDGAGDGGNSPTSHAEYVLGCRFRLEPAPAGLRAEPAEFETKLHREADPPGEDGWLFFRDNCWRGELNDPDYLRDLTEDALGVTVLSVDFRELRTDEAYLSALKAEIDANLNLFNADSTAEVLSKYLGSSIRVVDDA